MIPRAREVLRSSAKAAVMRAIIGGPPVNKNNVTTTNVTAAAIAGMPVSNRSAGALFVSDAGADAGGPFDGDAIAPALCRSSSKRFTILAMGPTFALIVATVRGAFAYHSCAGPQRDATPPAASDNTINTMTAALTPRGTRFLCNASTGPESTRLSSNASATGMNAECAKYRTAATVIARTTLAARSAMFSDCRPQLRLDGLRIAECNLHATRLACCLPPPNV